MGNTAERTPVLFGTTGRLMREACSPPVWIRMTGLVAVGQIRGKSAQDTDTRSR